MKRIIVCMIALACLLTAFALAEEPTVTMTMKVIKCKQAVNLRKTPSTNADSLGLVPLDTELTGCAAVEDSDWISVTYEGVAGYIRSDFLELIAIEEPEEEVDLGPIAERELPMIPPITSIFDTTDYVDDDIILSEEVAGVQIVARQIFAAANEYLMVVGQDANGNQLWMQQTAARDKTEMTQTAAFIGGTADAPLVMMYNDWLGLSALDPATGETRWEITKEDVFLGGSISTAIGSDGTLYIGGYYEPTPVAIAADGRVLWQSDSSAREAQWLYRIELTDSGVAASYSSLKGTDGQSDGTIVYDYNTGAEKEILFD